MRYSILDKIDADDHLAQLLNAYMRALCTLEQVVLPRHSMHEFRRLLDSAVGETPSEESNQTFLYAVPRFYQLQVLANSLTDLHKNVCWAINALTRFFADYDGNLRRYAIENRLRVLDEFGSDDESDWEPDGFDGQDQKWKVAYKEDEAALAPYTLRQDVMQYFPGSDTNGEKIGTSETRDYAYFSDHVTHATALSPLKLLRQFTGTALPVYDQNEAGDLVERSLGDEVESELNEDLRNQALVGYFYQVLDHARRAAATFAAATTAEHFRALLTQLEAIRDVGFPSTDAGPTA